ncbi:MAG: hypothetical protein Q9163_004525 [Psora crenata]
MPISDEGTVLANILEGAIIQDDKESDFFVEAKLEDFTIYRPHCSRLTIGKSGIEGTQANEMVCLHEINERHAQHFFFDGVLYDEREKHYLQRVPFSILSIGGYQDISRSNVGCEVWIQSFSGKKLNIWYRLTLPSPEYRRYHWTFLWMADFGKHVVDYLYTHEKVCLNHFRKLFYCWLRETYPHDNGVDDWLGRYSDQDFRRMVTNQANYLFCQALQIDGSYEMHPLWAEILPGYLCAVPDQMKKLRLTERLLISTEVGSKTMRRLTTVTPYVSKCFQHMPWAKFLLPQNSVSTRIDVPTKWQTSEICSNPGWRSTGSDPTCKQVGVRDVVAIPSDAASEWKHQGAEWFAYVQGTSFTERGCKLSLLWLYRPVDTACMKMSYPFAQELFLSDHCNCGDSPVYADEVIRKLCVSFFGEPDTTCGDFFCRQQYLEGDGAWITLQPSHFRCLCYKQKPQFKYIVGDTVLISTRRPPHKTTLEPAVILQLDPDNTGRNVKVRKLLRKRRDYGISNADPNELVYTDQFEIIPQKLVARRCYVRFYRARQLNGRNIPAPYNRHGIADCYFITSQCQHGILECLRQPWPSDVITGWDPLQEPLYPPLKGLDIFCGGGNFGRGLEECGAVTFRWAVDYHREAIHTYKANLEDAGRTRLFFGCVNQYLSDALDGNSIGGLVAQKGEVEFIAAGSPCQGFSNANPKRGNDGGLINESMIASVVAFIDFYRPKYALIENVKGMAAGGDDKNVLAAVTCALVGLGYQVRTFALDAWSFGSAQSRTRVFISVAAPGLTPLPEPPLTHGHPKDVKGGSLGRTANGLQTSARYITPTPFDYISAMEATEDLPSTDARLSCIRYPDHRMSINMSTSNRVCISCIPRFPAGSGFLVAHARGFMPQAQLDNFNWSNSIRSGKASKAWSRLKRTGLMPTVMTRPHPDDGVSGRCLHWDDHRLMTILEARRAQGFPDHEVIVGSIADQWRIIGNGVARPVALALGMSLREAWLANNYIGGLRAKALDMSDRESEAVSFLAY